MMRKTFMDWRGNGSPLEDEIRLKPVVSRKPLPKIQVPTIDSSITMSSPDLSLRVVRQGTTSNVKEDPFDQLFCNGVKNKNVKEDPFDQLFCSGVQNKVQQRNLSSKENTVLSNDDSENFSNTEVPGGLFSSFTEKSKSPLPRKKSNRQRVTSVANKKPGRKKSVLNSNGRNLKTPVLNDTMNVDIKFQGDLTNPSTSRQKPGCSTPGLVPGTPVVELTDSPLGLTRAVALSLDSPTPVNLAKASVATSTPVLASRSSSQDTDFRLKDTTDIIDDSVFGPVSREVLQFSSNQVRDPLSSSVDEDSVELPVTDRSVLEVGMESIFINCVCGDIRHTQAKLIVCSDCQTCYHSDCVQLSEVQLEELELENLAWFCPNCRQGQQFGFSFSMEGNKGVRLSLASHGLTEEQDLVGQTLIEDSVFDASVATSRKATSSYPVDGSPESICKNLEIVAEVVRNVGSLSLFRARDTSTSSEIEAPSPSQYSVNASRSSFETPPTTSPVHTASPSLSQTALLERLAAASDSPLNSSLLFMKPRPPVPPRRKEQQVQVEFKQPEPPSLPVRSGKSWRRSLSSLKLGGSVSSPSQTAHGAGLRTPRISDAASAPYFTPKRSGRSSLCYIPATPHSKSGGRRQSISRASFVPSAIVLEEEEEEEQLCFIPATPQSESGGRRQSISWASFVPSAIVLKEEEEEINAPSPDLVPTSASQVVQVFPIPFVEEGESTLLSTSNTPVAKEEDPFKDTAEIPIDTTNAHISRVVEEQLPSETNCIPTEPLQSPPLQPPTPNYCAQVTQLDEKQELLHCCTRQEVVENFSEIYSEQVMAGARKVGEGAFGEVFLIDTGEDGGNPVLKVVPIGGATLINDDNQTTLEAMLSEVKISNSLSQLRSGGQNETSGYVEVRGCHVFEGKYPQRLLELWDHYDEEKVSENDRPDCLPSDQWFIALEFNNGGRDLEKYTFKNASQALAAWTQVAHTLAVAEKELQFEHRDLHWGNVLIRETKEKMVSFRLGGDTYQVMTEGVSTTIIDFSLSRMEVGGSIIFNNLAEDPDLFKAKGKDQGGDYQFDIYRKMKENNKNCWSGFHPRTNMFWLHYMLDKLVPAKAAEGVHYTAKKTAKNHKSGLTRLRNLRDSILEDFGCAADWVRREGDRLDDC